jgi:hypothetical protein
LAIDLQAKISNKLVTKTLKDSRNLRGASKALSQLVLLWIGRVVQEVQLLLSRDSQ